MSDKDAWSARAEKELRGRALNDLTWETPEGIAVQPVYGPQSEHAGAIIEAQRFVPVGS